MDKIENKHIYLLGFMGCGKSTLGRKLANILDMPFVDTDILVEVKVGMTVSTIFEMLGEAKFRELELEVLAELASDGKIAKVVALGGGTPTLENVWPLLQNSGTTIYLQRTAEQLYDHVRHTDHRPVLKRAERKDLLQHVQNLLHARTPYYARANHTFICDDDWGIDETIERLLKLIEENHENN
ncbi:MAG: shikimate kinase [Calditrichaeota bacterium]|nr:MAG: shikimate kinase [Calditrichota bacterium]